MPVIVLHIVILVVIFAPTFLVDVDYEWLIVCIEFLHCLLALVGLLGLRLVCWLCV